VAGEPVRRFGERVVGWRERVEMEGESEPMILLGLNDSKI
jgi:hypothetical protein